MQVGRDVRQRDVHGGDVEDDHQLGDEQHRQKPAMRRAPGVFGACVLVNRGVVRGVLGLGMHDVTPSKLDDTV